MEFALPPTLERFREEVGRYLDSITTPELLAELEGPEGGHLGAPHTRAFIRRLGADGWLGIGWPKEYGGMGRGWWEQFIFFEELYARGLPFPVLECAAIGPTIMRVGTEEQRREFLPPILRGELVIAVGYTEPNAGTDLASLQTRAVREGDEYVINGQKIFTSNAGFADYIWLAARTDPDAPKHRGISIFMVDTRSPGFSAVPLEVWGGVRTYITYYDNVRVPASRLIGQENDGWRLIGMQLDFERIALSPVSMVERLLRELMEWACRTTYAGKPVADDPWVGDQLAQLAVEVEVAKMLAYRNVWLIERGEVPYVGASMAKVFTVDLQLKLAHIGIQVMDLYGQLTPASPDAPLRGRLERLYERVRILTFGGGTREIQLDIIGYKGLGLPRG